MWISIPILFYVTLAVSVTGARFCRNVLQDCMNGEEPWTSCYERRIVSCTLGRNIPKDFIHHRVNMHKEAEENVTPHHKVYIPSSALQKSSTAEFKDEVVLVATVINSTYFKLTPPQRKGRKLSTFNQPAHRNGIVLGGLVLAVKAGNHSVTNLSQPVKLTFKYNTQVENGTCVFWKESTLVNGTGYWSTDGCDTSDIGTEFICSCNHLSFFAVLVNPVLSLDERNSAILTYLTYTGSGLSVIFTVISLIIYSCLHQRRSQKVISVHIQLTAALLCLHLSFLLSCFWVQLLNNDEGWVCKVLGLLLHWALLATFSWAVLEGFHVYLLLIRVFNIYVQRYLLKLSLVGWGLPTLIAVVCGISGVYGKYTLEIKDANNRNSTAQMCWMNNQVPQRPLVSFITTVALPCVVMILYNSCMLGLVVFKLQSIRKNSIETGSSWKMKREKDLWKDSVTVLGLSCVLGLSWVLATFTYISVPGIYIFTIINSLQGVFMFLWSLALTCKSRSDTNSSGKDDSCQKMMTTSFNN
ncbi:adhesion G protein-coupled receptor G3 [Mastacembelus armatus]|uniref:Adhesion G protein-coupled receptor G3-like n=2 Tax=Mastacembelus armatus TaxID=205130 RepID=A0A3Q3LTP4_9TELE|nr:adhesion G protein-coupled receptor G3-like [Mastacembelus armatus]